ncbi:MULTISPECIES: hypothetical protein [Streptomyces]|uniref:Peptidase inhibitor family I36 n=1 Tax=Streptomyces misionensis TaxID=67331 RepID=A0A1H4UIT2_9ACTN|nr:MULTISPECIES: hypothetical protein [Streptomyces]SEC68328.1 hypothetical protein SAMN04490357_2623 [Streptomyces misionensis]SFY50483.1 hypothetical protein STEPF1_03737 [Streptomyces sp. F-1]
MKAQRARRLAAVSAVGVLLAGGATIATAGSASAATQTHVTTNRGCYGHNCFGFNRGFDRGGFFFNNGFNRFGYGNTPVVVVVVP